MPWIHKTEKFCECGNLMSRKDAKCRKCGRVYLILPFDPYTEEEKILRKMEDEENDSEV